MDETLITATEASRSFSELLHRVCYGGESFLIKKGNRLMARIAPVETLSATALSAAPATQEEIPEGLSPEEAQYFQTLLEQLRPEPA